VNAGIHTAKSNYKEKTMNLKRMIFRAALLIGAATLLMFSGCGLPAAQGSGATQTTIGRSTLPRQHWETIDRQDWMFYTYWESPPYTGGTVNMNLAINGFDLMWSNYSNHNIVTGKGVKPCYGETISWKTNQNTGANFFGVYGWLKDPLVEYYIGRSDQGGNKNLGTYTADGKTYTLWIDETPNRANILNPDSDSRLPLKFLQFNCGSADGAGISPVNMAEHYAGWEQLLINYKPPAGWDWHNIILPDYCVVGVEVFNGNPGTYPSGHVVVSEIKMSGICRLKFDSADNYLSAMGTVDHPVVAAQSLDTGWDSQKWTIENIPGGYSKIKNNWSGWYLTCKAGLNTTEQYAEVYCRSANSIYPDTQKWKIEDANGVVRLQHSSGLYLTLNDGNLEGSVIICQPLHKDGSSKPDWISQNWTKDTSAGIRFKSVWGGRYLTCTANIEGGTVRAQPLNTSWESEKWLCENIDGPDYIIRLKNIRSGKYLAAYNTNDGSPVVMNPGDSALDSQKWEVVPGTFWGTYRLKNVSSQKYLTVKSGSAFVELSCNTLRGMGNRDVSQLWNFKYFW
jgi:endo-1,4-beta-xylanase